MKIAAQEVKARGAHNIIITGLAGLTHDSSSPFPALTSVFGACADKPALAEGLADEKDIITIPRYRAVLPSIVLISPALVCAQQRPADGPARRRAAAAHRVSLLICAHSSMGA
jgi:hypothetical protein